MEPATEQDIWEHWLLYRPHLTQRLCTFGIVLEPTDESIIYNLAYATAMARFHYARVPEKLPHHEDVDGLAKYWKSHYNTHLGKGTVGKFVELYHKFDIGGVTWEE